MFKIINGWTKEKMKAQILVKNNGYQSRNGSMCAYRSQDGNRCAAGCFIPDDKYRANMECNSVRGILLEDHYGLLSLFPLDQLGMTMLQGAHDNCSSQDSEDMREVLCRWVDQNCEDSV